MASTGRLSFLVLAGCIAASSAAAQNGASFSAATPTSPYAEKKFKPAVPCAQLRARGDAVITIIGAETIAAANDVPEHCRVTGLIAPEIRFEVNLPANWNGRFYMHGNGGFAGETPESGARPVYRATALRNGFATATTNTGHDAAAEPLATFGLNYSKVIDYAFRGVHMTAEAAKGIIASYYNTPIAYSYWDGCSTGGRQGLISAQRYPQDFDGIIAGAPVLNFVDTTFAGNWIAQALREAPLTIAKLNAVGKAVYERCDAKDGLKDGLIDDPRMCDFDATKHAPLCAQGEDKDDCLTPAQAATVKKIHTGMVSNGKPYFVPIVAVGTEAQGIPTFGPPNPTNGWAQWIIGGPSGTGPGLQILFGDAFAKYMAFGKPDPNYDTSKFDFDKDVGRTADIRRILNADNPDLSGLRARNGKVLMYFGWADPALSPYMGIDYYERALKANDKATDNIRLFMVPGMGHCRGGVGTDRFDAMTALVNWIERGIAPEKLVATRMLEGKVVRTRPLCLYPQVARYSGSGSTDEEANFTCKAPD